MAHPEEYDVLVLGSAAAGKLLSYTPAAPGEHVAVPAKSVDAHFATRTFEPGRTSHPAQVDTARKSLPSPSAIVG
jgi:hypothetical protein